VEKQQASTQLNSGNLKFHPASFRDRSARVILDGDKVLRLLDQTGYEHWKQLKQTKFLKEILGEQKLISTKDADLESSQTPKNGKWVAALEHEKIPVISYPYEWSFGMLKSAALLQLELLERAMNENFTLKDSSAFNVQFIGSRPYFIDVMSFEPLNPGEPWTGYKQFCEMYLFPLFLESYKGISYRPWFRGDIEGVSVEVMASMISARDLLRAGVFKHVFLQSKLQRGLAGTKQSLKTDLSKAGFNKELILINIRSLKKLVSNLNLPSSRSTWSEYASDNSYDKQNAAVKQEFVAKWSAAKQHPLVWDLGSNTGTYSRIAVNSADYVVAMDGDTLAVEQLFSELKKEKNEKVLPLVMSIANPSSSTGWRGQERQAIAERSKPSLILSLALIHHIVISANIPLAEFIDWLRSFNAELIIEFVTKDDAMVKQLLLNKKDIYDDYNLECFESCLAENFKIVEKAVLPNQTRILYFAQPF